jgi:flavin reductase (DIM6/NTAB) family NADH-FMN oxidoreductase RutF
MVAAGGVAAPPCPAAYRPHLDTEVALTRTPIPASFDTVDAELFRQLLRRHAAAVVVVTACGDRPAGFTATSFTSVSAQPPLVAFAVSRTASTWSAMSRAETIAVHVLSRSQEDAARTFAASGIDRFTEYRDWRVADDGA